MPNLDSLLTQTELDNTMLCFKDKLDGSAKSLSNDIIFVCPPIGSLGEIFEMGDEARAQQFRRFISYFIVPLTSKLLHSILYRYTITL
jgi:hypothetical protein